MRLLILFLSAALFSACNPLGNDGPKKDSSQTATSESAIDPVRANPKSTPVVNYEEKVDNDLNNWFFRVQLYETKERFVYRLVMQYEEINEEKEIRLPNLKTEPQPQIKKGEKGFEAIVGFLDNKNEFKDYIKVFVQDGNLQLKTLKHYAVSEKQQ